MIRQSWPETITAQEVFDHVLEHLREQKGVPCTLLGACRYRNGRPGEACAAGCLLTDEEASAIVEGCPWNAQFRDAPARLRPHAELIFYLQRLHDDQNGLQYKTSITVEAVSRIAGEFGLAYKKPEGEPW